MQSAITAIPVYQAPLDWDLSLWLDRILRSTSDLRRGELIAGTVNETALQVLLQTVDLDGELAEVPARSGHRCQCDLDECDHDGLGTLRTDAPAIQGSWSSS